MSTNRCSCEIRDESLNSHFLNCLTYHGVIQNLQAPPPNQTLAQCHVISVRYTNQPNSDDLTGMISKESDFHRVYYQGSLSSE
jgi:hypothetical protein